MFGFVLTDSDCAESVAAGDGPMHGPAGIGILEL
jgi:hypothetical protein